MIETIINLDTEYTFPGLDVKIKDVQKIELEILLEFDRICKEEGLTYQLFAGTLLGAIRHGGFIPWDDDIDVCMLREDYERFLTIAQEKLGEDYFLQSTETDPKYVNPFAKIRKNGTVFKEKLVKDVNMHHGVYIDLFPLDYVRPKTKLGHFQLKMLKYFRDIKKNRTQQTGVKESFFQKKMSNSMVDRRIKATLNLFSKNNAKFISDLVFNNTPKLYDDFAMRKETMDTSIMGNFEGHLFPMPENYDEVLKIYYGDYMTLPIPAEQNPHHHIIEIKL